MEDKFKIHLFTSENEESDELDWVRAFLDAGLDYIHIRKPGIKEEIYESFILKLPLLYLDRIILHDFPGLAQHYSVGFQYNSRHGYREGINRPISFSAHSIEEAVNLLHKQKEDGGYQYDFVTLSPIFDSISKEEYHSSFSFDAFKASDLSRIVALGGVTTRNMEELNAAGFAGAALLGDVWHKDGGKANFLKYLRLKNLRLQFITNAPTAEETIDQALEFMESGGRWIQVRMKDAPISEIKEVLEYLSDHCWKYGTTLIVDDHVELARYCHGVHLGQNDMPVKEARKILGKEKIVGLTVNNAEHIKASYDSLPDYYGVGPFRYTETKKNLAPILGLEGYRRLAPLMKRPFVAIGGIRMEDVYPILDTGAAGVALSSLISQAENIDNQVFKLTNMIYGEK